MLRTEPARHPDSPGQARDRARDLIELWMTLARSDWGSLVLIPADRHGSTTEIASELADIGQRISYGPVTAIAVRALEYGSALALADLQEHLERERRRLALAPATPAVPAGPGGSEVSPVASEGTGPAGAPVDRQDGVNAPVADPAPAPVEVSRSETLATVPPPRLIIAVPPVVVQPLGLKAAAGADAVVLMVRLHRSRKAEVRRTIELVGRDRVAGCLLVG